MSEKCVRRIAAEFGYAGIAVASVVEAVVKALFIPFIAVGVLIPNLREKSIHLFSESISGIPFSLFVSVIGLISLLLNPFQNRMHDNVPF